MIQVGIDLGTTNTVCCFIEDGKEKYVKFAAQDILPSILMLNNGNLIVGKRAKLRGVQYPHKLIRSSKTFMGDDTWSKTVEDRTFNATDAATEILTYVHQELLAMKKLPPDTPVEAVITVPAYFKAKQREATKEAGERANFIVKGIIQEPVAAAIAATNVVESERIFVLDLGGGTFDVSILHYDMSEEAGYKIESVEGDAHLGGDDFDNQILEWLYSQVAIQEGIDLRNEACDVEELPIVYSKLQKLAEEIKVELSNKLETTKRISNLFKTKDGHSFSFEFTMTRAQFEEECARLFRKIERTMKQALQDANLEPAQIDRILLVGGSSQIPKIYDMTVELFGKEPYKNYDLSRVVAAGAALYATEQNGIIDMVLPHSLGIEVSRDGMDEQMEIMLPRLAKYPLTKEKIFTTVRDYQESITVYVYEGEAQHIGENDYYGSLTLTGIEQATKGIPQISIRFTFDRDGILSVQAKDLNTDAEMSGQIQLDKQAQKKPTQTSANIVLLMDTSSSMGWQNKMDKAKEAANILVSTQLDLTRNYVALMGFANNYELLQSFTQDKTTLQIAIERLLPAGGTNLSSPFGAMPELFQSGAGESNCVIIVTDGCTEAESNAIKHANQLKDLGIRLITIGVGQDVKMDYLLKVSSSADDCYSIATMDELKDVFAKVSSTLQVAY